ncbi:MAG TPA: DUF4124 domain-containing protein [Casimicrobiaceae bacterium]|nr:DUF4124 domain-containing protein [Casimicrobiaceae bacterium]
MAKRSDAERQLTSIRSDALRVSALLLGALVAAAIAGNVHAALYKWTDEHGVVHYSDKLPAEAVNRANVELNQQGMAIRKTGEAQAVIARQSPKSDVEEQKVREEQRERIIAVRRDKALIESYTNVAEIDLAKSRAVGTVEAQIESANAFVAKMTKRRQELEEQKATFAPRPAPGNIAREIETIDDELGRQTELIASKKKEAASIAARYDADRQRFIELHDAIKGSAVTTRDGVSARDPDRVELSAR